MKESAPLAPKGGAATPLSKEEQSRYRALKGVIKKGQKTFVEVGLALIEIREQKLYRGDYKTFEAFCQEEYGFGRDRAYQLTQAAEIALEVSGGNADNCRQTGPANEGQARALRGVPAGQRREAFEEAVKTAPKGKVTARHVEKVVATRRQPTPPPAFTEPDLGDEPTTTREDAEVQAEMAADDFAVDAANLRAAIGPQLERIRAAAIEINRILGREKVRGKPDFANPLAWYFKPGHVDVFGEACDAIESCMPAEKADQHPGYLCVAQVKANHAAASHKTRRAS